MELTFTHIVRGLEKDYDLDPQDADTAMDVRIG